MGFEGEAGDGLEFAEVLAGPGVLDAVGGVVERGDDLALADAVALVLGHGGDGALRVERQVHLADFHVAVEGAGGWGGGQTLDEQVAGAG